MPHEDDPGPASPTTSAETRHEAAQVLRGLLAAVKSGELEAESAHAKALLRRVEGAVVGLEAGTTQTGPGRGDQAEE